MLMMSNSARGTAPLAVVAWVAYEHDAILDHDNPHHLVSPLPTRLSVHVTCWMNLKLINYTSTNLEPVIGIFLHMERKSPIIQKTSIKTDRTIIFRIISSLAPGFIARRISWLVAYGQTLISFAVSRKSMLLLMMALIHDYHVTAVVRERGVIITLGSSSIFGAEMLYYS
jgi:hypothetical protein